MDPRHVFFRAFCGQALPSPIRGEYPVRHMKSEILNLKFTSFAPSDMSDTPDPSDNKPRSRLSEAGPQGFISAVFNKYREFRCFSGRAGL
jgi:hypothetical protein